MEIHILLFEDRIERASVDALKICDLADAMNGGKDIIGPYSVVSVELEDATLTTNTADGKGRGDLDESFSPYEWIPGGSDY